MGSSRTRARTRVPCIGRRIPNHCATREALARLLIAPLEPCQVSDLWYLCAAHLGGIHRFWIPWPPLSQVTSLFRTSCSYVPCSRYPRYWCHQILSPFSSVFLRNKTPICVCVCVCVWCSGRLLGIDILYVGSEGVKSWWETSKGSLFSAPPLPPPPLSLLPCPVWVNPLRWPQNSPQLAL